MTYFKEAEVDSTSASTVKILKFRKPEKFAVITLKFEQGGSTIVYLCSNDADGMANRVDPAPLGAV